MLDIRILRRLISSNKIKNFSIRMASFTSNSGNKPFTVFVEGNIGSGKTTFLNHFKKFQNNIDLLTEPVDNWRNLNGINLLDLMYKNPDRWAMTFQNYVTLTMLKNHISKSNKPVKLMERSMYSARYCFVEKMRSSGVLHEGMYHVLQEWYNFIHEHHTINCDLIIYLRTTPEIVYGRMMERARSEESCVPLEYLKDLHQLHEDWLIDGKFPLPAPVHIVDANLDLDNIISEYIRSEDSILRPSPPPPHIDTPNHVCITASPSKRERGGMY